MTAPNVERIVDFSGRHVRDVERPVLFTEAGKPVPFPSGAVHPARTSVADMRAAKIESVPRTGTADVRSSTERSGGSLAVVVGGGHGPSSSATRWRSTRRRVAVFCRWAHDHLVPALLGLRRGGAR